jgi:hypothetical protein
MKYRKKQTPAIKYHSFHFCGEFNPDTGKNALPIFLSETKMPNTRKQRMSEHDNLT